MTIDANVASATMNSFCLLSEAEAYHSFRLNNTAWSLASNGDKEKALVSATRLLCTLRWRGVRSSATQALEFPRLGLSYTEAAELTVAASENYDSSGALGLFKIVVVTDSAVPEQIKAATAELALVLLTSDVESTTGTEGFSQIKVGPISLNVAPVDRSGWLTASVKSLCWRFLLDTGGVSAPVKRFG